MPPIPVHDVFSIFLLGEIGVVTRTPQADGFRVVGASTAERIVVVELEPLAFAAAPTPLVHESALVAITFSYGAPHRSRDVARLRPRIGVFF